MQSPTASDPSFKAFLEKLQEQNTRGFATHLLQLKAEREIAGEDGDKREEQLDQANENLKDLKDETTSVGDNLKSSLQDLSDDTIEVQDQLDTANDSLSEIATAIIGARESIEVEMLAALEGIKEAVTGIKLDVDFSELKTAIENVGYDVGKDIDSVRTLPKTMSVFALQPVTIQEWEALARENNPFVRARRFLVASSEQDILSLRLAEKRCKDLFSRPNHGVGVLVASQILGHRDQTMLLRRQGHQDHMSQQDEQQVRWRSISESTAQLNPTRFLVEV
jgi:DNA repair exonuclease SbcCD ATPase subunit